MLRHTFIYGIGREWPPFRNRDTGTLTVRQHSVKVVKRDVQDDNTHDMFHVYTETVKITNMPSRIKRCVHITFKIHDSNINLMFMRSSRAKSMSAYDRGIGYKFLCEDILPLEPYVLEWIICILLYTVCHLPGFHSKLYRLTYL